jgi:hypothetical protein
MSKAIRIEKSERARSRRNSVKEIKETLQKKKFAKLKNLRKKNQKLTKKHHDGK